jgi:predicted RNA binding protein with dsRBD fold (UPF0201 family)|tara:strand:- start:908 stop:1075 length:168 start_codon:yes stop_codon:yes gene_type:complete
VNQEVIDNFIKVFEDYELEVVRDGMNGKYYLFVCTKEKDKIRIFKLEELLRKNNS